MTPKLLQAADVCEMAQLQPYVLRSWEKEFPGIGVQRAPDSTRMYRPSDVEQVLRIKQLVFGEGLTLAGARRRLEDQPAAPAVDAVVEMRALQVGRAQPRDARAAIATVRDGLRGLLDALSAAPGEVAMERVAAPPDVRAMAADTYELRPPTVPTPIARPKVAAGKVKTRAVASRGKAPRMAAKPAPRARAASGKRKRANA
jgi:DNA-binding transcriptional MerR regulator